MTKKIFRYRGNKKINKRKSKKNNKKSLSKNKISRVNFKLKKNQKKE